MSKQFIGDFKIPDGMIPTDNFMSIKCLKCNGKGYTMQPTTISFGKLPGQKSSTLICYNCSGTGYVRMREKKRIERIVW